jgi:hypothetical protein
LARRVPKIDGTRRRWEPQDQIRYHGEPGTIEVVVVERCGVPERDWFLEQFPDGGAMLTAHGFGAVFLAKSNIDEDLELVARGDD